MYINNFKINCNVNKQDNPNWDEYNVRKQPLIKILHRQS